MQTYCRATGNCWPLKAKIHVPAVKELTVVTCSTKLAPLHYELSSVVLKTQVEFMNELREQGLRSERLALMTYERGDPPYATRDGLIVFLIYRSPKWRISYSAIHETCFQLGSKSLVVEDILICAKFYEDSERIFWVHYEVLHLELNHKQRQKLLDDCNKKSSTLRALIVMVDVASQGPGTI